MEVTTMADMKGQVALVTGGIRGIGLAICERLAGRGVTVAAGYSANAEAARQFRDKYADYGATVHQGDVGSGEDCARVVSEVLDQHGQLDILVNNAGITVDKTVRKMTPADWDHVIGVNLSGAFYLSRAVLQHMLDRGYGRIVNISSVIGSAGGFGRANYEHGPGDGEEEHHRQHGHPGVHQHRHDRGRPGGCDGEYPRQDPGRPAR